MMPRPVRAEVRPRQHGDAGLVEQPVRQGALVDAGPGDVRERVERPARHHARDAREPVQTLDQDLAPAHELGHHRVDRVVRAGERGDPGQLHRRRRAGDRVDEEPREWLDQRGRHRRIPEPPPGHGIRLREAVEQDGPVEQAVRGDRIVDALVEQLRVHLVGQDPAVVVGEDAGDLDVQLAVECAARRVGGRVQNHHPRPRREPLRQVVRREREVRLLGDRKRHRRGARPVDRRLVDRIARVRVDHLVAFARNGEHAEEEEPLGARCHQHAGRVDGHAARAGEVLRSRLAQLGKARGRAVVRVTLAEGPHARLDDVRRGVEVGLADLEVDDVPPLCLESPRPGEDLERPLGSEPLVVASESHDPSVPSRRAPPGGV